MNTATVRSFLESLIGREISFRTLFNFITGTLTVVGDDIAILSPITQPFMNQTAVVPLAQIGDIIVPNT